jgi:tRNA 2-thiouridine synthesizing protein A
MTTAEARPTVVEARGVLCPVPIIRLARAARTLPAGSIVELLSDDPAAEHDVPAWCRLRGHSLLSVTPCDEPAPNEPAHPTSLAVDGEEPAVGAPRAGHPLRHVIRLAAAEPGV